MLNQNDIISFPSDQLLDLQAEYGISKIGLFGSYARNEQNEKSDIDILLEFEPGTKDIYEKKTKLKEFLIRYFQSDVDLCREKYVKPYVRDYLVKEVIYAEKDKYQGLADNGEPGGMKRLSLLKTFMRELRLTDLSAL